MNKEPSQVKKSKDEILMQVCNITDKEEWSYVEHITPIQALKAMGEYRSQASSELPSDEECNEIAFRKLLLTGRTESEEIQDRKLIIEGLTIMRSIASPLLASHVARILELEESKIIANGFYVVARNSEEDWEQITQQMDSLEKAKDYLNDTFCKQKYPYAFIVAKII